MGEDRASHDRHLKLLQLEKPQAIEHLLKVYPSLTRYEQVMFTHALLLFVLIFLFLLLLFGKILAELNRILVKDAVLEIREIWNSTISKIFAIASSEVNTHVQALFEDTMGDCSDGKL